MNLSDTFYIALCMTVLILGVVYWFWTQNQFILRKLNLLENIVYEMKSALPSPDTGGVSAALNAVAAASSSTAPVYSAPVELDDDDLLHDDLSNEFVAMPPPSPKKEESKEQQEDHEEHVHEDEQQHDVPGSIYGFLTEVSGEDLQPGGVGSGIHGPDEPDTSAKGAVLDGMTLKELRRLAEQKGLNLPKNARKQELIDAIRGAKSTLAPFDISEGKTLDFTM